MIDIVVTCWLAVVGLVGLSPLSRRLGWGVVGLALPTGAAIYTLIVLSMLAAQIPFSVATALIIATAAAGTVAIAAGGVGAVGSAVRSPWAGLTVLAHAVVGAATHALHLTRLTVDSVRYLVTADVLQTTGSLDAASPWDVRMRHLVTPVLHTGGIAEGGGYSASMTPLFAASGLAITGWLAWRLFERQETPLRTRMLLLGSIGALVLTTNRFVYHAFYVNGHMFFAVFAVAGVGLVVLAVAEGEWGYILPASLALATIVPLRPEGLLTVAVLIVPALVGRRVPMAARWRLAAPILVSAILWNGVLWPSHAVEADLGVFGPVYGNLIVAAGVGIGLGLLAVPRIRPFATWGPWMLTGLLAACIAVGVVDDSSVLRDSLAALGANLAVEGLWGTTWWVAAFLLGAAWLTTRSEEVHLLLTPLPIFAVAVFAFAYLRDGAYRVGTGDSANRMLLHIILVAALAVLAAAAEATASTADANGEQAMVDKRPHSVGT